MSRSCNRTDCAAYPININCAYCGDDYRNYMVILDRNKGPMRVTNEIIDKAIELIDGPNIIIDSEDNYLVYPEGYQDAILLAIYALKKLKGK